MAHGHTCPSSCSECVEFFNPYPSGGFVICFSGCQDEQTSADLGNIENFEIDMANIPGPGGALTCALLRALDKNVNCGFTTYARLLKRMRAFLRYQMIEQRPMLSTNVNFCLNLHVFSTHKFLAVNNFRALQVGVSYSGTSRYLPGTHNDIRRMRAFMVHHGFPEDEFEVLLDDGEHELPTRSAILAAIQDLVRGSQKGDTLFFQYSGHGGEVSGNVTTKQTIVPCDLIEILDTELHKELVDKLPKGVKLLCMFDSCHSASVMNLPYFHRYIDYESKAEGFVDGISAAICGARKRRAPQMGS